MNKKSLVWWIVGAQVILCAIAFIYHCEHPLDSLLYDLYDGFKNNFTLASYVTLPENSNFRFGEYYGMNYPYGDMVVFTDNTPALSIPLKWIDQNIVSLDKAIFPLFNWLLISGIIWSSLLIFFILKNTIHSKYLIFVASVSLPWINPQLIRFSNGHFNMALSCLLLWALYQTIRLIRSYEGGRTIKHGFYLAAIIFLSSMFHVYYLAILSLFTSLILLVYFMVKKGPWDIRPFLGSIWIPAISGVLFIGTCLLLGQDVISKSTNSPGFDMAEWRLNPLGLITSYPHFGIDYLIQSSSVVHYESNSYLGAFFLFAFLIFLVTKKWHATKLIPDDPLWRSIFIAGVICVISALGVRIQIPFLNITVENFISPFYWLGKSTDLLQHFRCLGRFNWPFFWACNFIMIFAIDRIVLNQNISKWIKLMFLILPVFLALDAKDSIRFHNRERYQNIFITHDQQCVNQLSQGISSDSFEAILSLPYFHVGSGSWQYTFDGETESVKRTFQLATKLKLPLINSLMSRTTIDDAKKQYMLFENIDSSSVKELHSDKPILVLINEEKICQMEQEAFQRNQYKVIDFIPKQLEFISNQPLNLINEEGDWKLYSWQVDLGER